MFALADDIDPGVVMSVFWLEVEGCSDGWQSWHSSQEPWNGEVVLHLVVGQVKVCASGARQFDSCNWDCT